MSLLQELGTGPAKHPNIVELVDIFQLRDSTPCIVIEFVGKGSLQGLLAVDPTSGAQQKMLEPKHIKNLAFQVLSGLHYLHSNFILHRDLKPDNLMIASDGTLKFIDFGMARSYGAQVPFSQNQITFVYRPPEIFFGAMYYGPSADIWSAGCILAELLIKRPLFPGSTTSVAHQLNRIFSVRGTPDQDPEWDDVRLLEKYQKYMFASTKETPLKELFPNESPQFLDLLDQMLQLNPNKRISAGEALQHAYFTQEQPPMCQNADLPIN